MTSIKEQVREEFATKYGDPNNHTEIGFNVPSIQDWLANHLIHLIQEDTRKRLLEVLPRKITEEERAIDPKNKLRNAEIYGYEICRKEARQAIINAKL